MPAAPRPLSALLAPFTAVRREFADILANRVACLGGIAGSSAFIAGAAAMALLGPATSDAADAEPDELVMEFLPGELVRLGEKPDPDKIPEKFVIQDTSATAPPADTKVTDDQTITDPPPKPTDRPDPKPSTQPHDPNKPVSKPSDRDRTSNTPYDDPATVDQLPGDPFGSPQGWSDLAKDGDPWATAVLAALNGMTVGSYAGLGQDVSYKFQLVICADGSIDEVRTKKSTGKPDFDGQIRNALQILKLPKAPAAVAKQLAGKCKKIPYEFTWSGKTGNGKVK